MLRKVLDFLAGKKKEEKPASSVPEAPKVAGPPYPLFEEPDDRPLTRRPEIETSAEYKCPRDVEPHDWWKRWVDKKRENPYNSPDYLYFGMETHKRFEYGLRQITTKERYRSHAPYRTSDYPLDNFFRNIWDVREWQNTKVEPLYLHEDLFEEHCYVMGPTGSGKTSLGIMPLLIQLLRGTKHSETEAYASKEARTPKRPVVILDLKGDPALFHTVRLEAHARGQKFLFFTPEQNAPTYRFNPFKGFDRTSSSVAQLCQLILDALGLNHGKGYGRGYYTQRSRQALSDALNEYPNVSSFRELTMDALPRSLKMRMREDRRAKSDAFELASVIETLYEYDQLVTLPEEKDAEDPGIIFMPRVVRDCEVAYFWLPAALESISVGEIAKLALFNLRMAAQEWKRSNPHKDRQIVLVIDEFQHVAGENLRGILQDARSFGIGAILANQGLHDLKTPAGFDLAPAVMANTRVKLFFTTDEENDCYVYVERGAGSTLSRPFPKPGNPWLTDLAPEDFAYRTSLQWPLARREYRERAAMPLPDWGDIPGGDSWVKKVQEKKKARRARDVRPQTAAPLFVPKDDAEAKRQKEKLSRLADDL